MATFSLSALLKDFSGKALKEDTRVENLLVVIDELIQRLAPEEQMEYAKRLENFHSDLTLLTALRQMCGYAMEGITPEESGKVFTMVAAMCVSQGDEYELDSKDVTLLQKACGKAYGRRPLLFGQLEKLLDGKNPFDGDKPRKTSKPPEDEMKKLPEPEKGQKPMAEAVRNAIVPEAT